jgi:hypothetical protein
MLHVTIHAGPRDVACQAERQYQGQLVSPLALAPGDWLPLAVTFEQVAAALEVLPRMYFEPDGSFVWVAPEGEPHWQLDGQLQDRGAQLDYVELKGTCAEAACAQLWEILRGDAPRLVFQLVAEGVFVDEATATRLLSSHLP